MVRFVSVFLVWYGFEYVYRYESLCGSDVVAFR